MDQVRSIAVLKYGALGDMLLTRPFLITLRQYFPQSRIVLGLISIYKKGIPYDLIDDIHVVDKGERSVSRIYRNYKELGSHDIIFDISATTRSFWVTRLNKATLKIGFIYKGVHRLFYDVAVARSDYRFEAETFLDQLLVLGLSYEWPLEFGLPRKGIDKERPCILYFSTASKLYKCWPAERFAELIRGLSQELPDYDHILLAGIEDWEREICRNIGEAVGQRGNFRIAKGGDDALRWVMGAELVVSNDTGIRNMAIAAGRPTVGVFFSTLPFRYLPRFGFHEAVFRADRRPPTVEQVRTAVQKVLRARMSKDAPPL